VWLYRPTALRTARRELAGHSASAAALAGTVRPGGLGSVPLVVLSAADATEGQRQAHRRWATWSRVGDHVVATTGGHYVQLDDPDAVVAAVEAVLAE
jgi:pimeloyl-ACP methyl ester carboxylesterase